MDEQAQEGTGGPCDSSCGQSRKKPKNDEVRNLLKELQEGIANLKRAAGGRRKSAGGIFFTQASLARGLGIPPDRIWEVYRRYQDAPKLPCTMETFRSFCDRYGVGHRNVNLDFVRKVCVDLAAGKSVSEIARSTGRKYWEVFRKWQWIKRRYTDLQKGKYSVLQGIVADIDTRILNTFPAMKKNRLVRSKKKRSGSWTSKPRT